MNYFIVRNHLFSQLPYHYATLLNVAQKALSIQKFINGLNGLTEVQERQYLEKNNNIIISGYATVEDVTGSDYPDVKLTWHNKYSDTWDLIFLRCRTRFNKTHFKPFITNIRHC